jgi:AraC family transcriptional regulator, transcriptional activator of pobA
LGRTRERGKRGGGPPVFTFEAAPGAPLVSTLRFGRELASSGGLPGAHSHDFLTLAYFERDGGSLRLGDRRRELKAGDAFVSSPGEVHDPSGLAEAEGWAVFFPAEVLAPSDSNVFLSWRAHPLLFPFVGGVDRTGGVRGGWSYPRRSAPRGPRACPPWTSSSASAETGTGRRRWRT